MPDEDNIVHSTAWLMIPRSIPLVSVTISQNIWIGALFSGVGLSLSNPAEPARQKPTVKPARPAVSPPLLKLVEIPALIATFGLISAPICKAPA